MLMQSPDYTVVGPGMNPSIGPDTGCGMVLRSARIFPTGIWSIGVCTSKKQLTQLATYKQEHLRKKGLKLKQKIV